MSNLGSIRCDKTLSIFVNIKKRIFRRSQPMTERSSLQIIKECGKKTKFIFWLNFSKQVEILLFCFANKINECTGYLAVHSTGSFQNQTNGCFLQEYQVKTKKGNITLFGELLKEADVLGSESIPAKRKNFGLVQRIEKISPFPLSLFLLPLFFSSPLLFLPPFSSSFPFSSF